MASKNQFNHVEIPVLDFKKAKEFFETIFDWQVDLETYPDYGFVNFSDSPPYVSLGLFKVDKIPAKGINVVFSVESIEDTLKTIVTAGGKVVKDKSLIAEDVGYSAQFSDCFGNEFGLHSTK